MKRFLSVLIIVSFIASSFMAPQRSYAQEQLTLPVPGNMVNLSAAYVPVLVKGLKVHPENPLLFDFILDAGKSGFKVNSSEFKAESEKLIKYFLASLTIKEDDLWVNLSPYEKDRIVPDELGKTELGRDMLAQDYILKQLTASLIYPEKQLGKEFWNKIYAKAQQMYGSSEVPVNTFNKVWIIADKAKVLERNNVAYVVGSHLKVMLEEDYMALDKHSALTQVKNDDKAHTVASQIVREIIIPELEKEVNQGQNFAPLRQMFYSMILASWYKLTLKDALLNQVYSNKAKTGGVLSNDPAVKEKIYEQYLKAYKKGVFNYIKDDLDAVSKQLVPRKYFSGGLAKNLGIPKILDRAQTATPEEMNSMNGDLAMASVNMTQIISDAAMNTKPVNAYEDFYNSFGAMNHPERHITQEGVNAFSKKFLTSDAKLLPPNQRRLSETWGVDNEPYGVTEVYFVPENETQRRMVAFQTELKEKFGDKVYLVDADKLHFTTQGLEQQWDDQQKQTKKPLALHSGLDKIDVNNGAILQVRSKARSIETPAVKMQVAKLNFNPQTGIFWELRPYLTDLANDPIKQRRKAWELPEPRPPHITAAYFTQEFSSKEEEELRALLAKYSDVTHFGDIDVDKVEVIGYSNFAFNSSQYDQGYVVLESVLLKKDTVVRQDGSVRLPEEIIDDIKEKQARYDERRDLSREPGNQLSDQEFFVKNKVAERYGNFDSLPRGKGLYGYSAVLFLEPDAFMSQQLRIIQETLRNSLAYRNRNQKIKLFENEDIHHTLKTYTRWQEEPILATQEYAHAAQETIRGTAPFEMYIEGVTLDQFGFKVVLPAYLGKEFRRMEQAFRNKSFPRIDFNIALVLSALDNSEREDLQARLNTLAKIQVGLKRVEHITLVAHDNEMLNRPMGVKQVYFNQEQGVYDPAMIEAQKGGIDLNAKNMGLDIAKEGQGVEMKFDPAMVAQFQRENFSGIVPVIIRITPISSALPILGL